MKTLLLLLIVAFAFHSSPAQDYSRIYADNGNTCYFQDTILKPPLVLKWRAFTEGSFKASPVVFKGRLFVTDRQGQLYSFDAETGELLWKKYYLTNSFSANDITPLVYGDYLYYLEQGRSYGDAAGYLKCVRQSDGKEVWSHSPIGKHWSHPHFSPIVYRNRIYMYGSTGTSAGTTAHYYCFTADSGKLEWERTFDSSWTGAAIQIQSGALCTLGVKPFLLVSFNTDPFGSLSNGLTAALTADSGRVLWQSSLFANGRRISLIDSIAYFSSVYGPTKNRFVAVNALSGDTVWTKTGIRNYYYIMPALDKKFFYAREYASSVYCYDRKSGRQIASCDFGGLGIPAGGNVVTGCGNMILCNGYGYGNYGHGHPGNATYVPPGGTPRSGLAQGVYAFEMAKDSTVTKMKVVWYYKMASNLCSTPSVYNGKLYVTANNEGVIYCFENAK